MMARIKSIEYHLAAQRVTNQDLAKENPDWNFTLIEKITGILTRHIVSKTESSLDLAVGAAEKIFKSGVVAREDIDGLIYCTQSPEYVLPSSACVMQERLKLPVSTAAFDYNLGCSGYIYGLAIGSAMLETRILNRILLICADTYSQYIDRSDRTTRTVFGDGAAATLLERSDDHQTIGPFVLGTDGSGKDKIMVTPKLVDNTLAREKYRLYVDGPGTYLFALQRVPETVEGLLRKAEKSIEDIDCFVFHQASRFVIDELRKVLSLKEEKVFCCYEDIGNTVSASIPIALKKAEEKRVIKTGDLIMLVGFGVGLSWGSCLVRW